MSHSSPYQVYGHLPNTSSTSPYPPNTKYDASSASLERDSSDGTPFSHPGPKGGPVTVDMRPTNRTPSPTPSELKELNKKGLLDWQAMKSWKFWFRREWTCTFAVFSSTTFGLPSVSLRRVLCHRYNRRCLVHPHYGVPYATCSLATASGQMGARVSTPFPLLSCDAPSPRDAGCGT